MASKEHHGLGGMIPGEIPIPHGPHGDNDDRDDYPLEGGNLDERLVFSHVTRPDDSYTPDGTYWADLPFSQRVKFVSAVDRQVASEELSTIWSMIKRDPLSPLSWYFRNAVIPGAGLGLEGYVLFSIGNLAPLFAAAWPECWGSKPTECNPNWIASVTYLEVVGIMFGQVIVGVSAHSQLAN
jgi:hypothetical protein